MFLIGSIVGFAGFIILLIIAIVALDAGEVWSAAAAVIFALAFGILGWYCQTHRSVPALHTGVSKNSITQELAGPFGSGIVKKPFFGTVYNFPSSSNYEKCEVYTPSIRGSYGVVLDICYYYDTGQINWVKEINKTGSFNAGAIMATWRNSVVGDIARSVKEYTPEQLSDERSQVEADMFTNVSPWFGERAVVLNSISFKNWEFQSLEVASAFDESIVSQRKIAEQAALLEAAIISREREEYEAETGFLVAEMQKESIAELGLSGSDAVQYLWMKALLEMGVPPDVLILGSGAQVSVPVR